MFSKYSEKVPPNYGGSRFKRTEAYETETKSHKPSDFSAVKSSVSPSFEQAKPSVKDEELDYAEEFDITDESMEPYIESSEPLSSYEEQKNENNEKHPLSELFSKISAEDLLLICLILFLSADKSLKNNDMIILLSLLLCV